MVTCSRFTENKDLPDRHTDFDKAMGQPCVYLLNGAMKNTKGILEGEPVHAGPDADRSTLTLLKSMVWSDGASLRHMLIHMGDW